MLDMAVEWSISSHIKILTAPPSLAPAWSSLAPKQVPRLGAGRNAVLRLHFLWEELKQPVPGPVDFMCQVLFQMPDIDQLQAVFLQLVL